MSLFITSLGSGSNGNCYYIGNTSEAILVDAGISCRETVLRMSRLGLSMDRVKAIFVSHEHADHISGIRVLSKKYRLPVYITPDTLRLAGRILEKEHIRHFSVEEPICIGELSIKAFKKCHDAVDPHSFVISSRGINIGVFTDIGNACKQVITHFSQCDAAFLESNYCENMLRDGNYPFILKKRISGGDGHLSNSQALELFTKYRGTQLKYLVLSHLSQNNNKPSIVEELFSKVAGNTNIIIATRYRETEVIEVLPGERNTTTSTPIPVYNPAQQLSLF